MRVGKMHKGNTYWDFNGDGQFPRTRAYGKARRFIRKWWVRQLKKRIDE